MPTIGEVSEIPWEFVWKIPDFLSLSNKEDEFYSSPLFHFAGSLWYLILYPSVSLTDDEVEKSVGVFLHGTSFNSPVNMDFCLGLKTVDKKIDPEYKYTYVFKKAEGFGTPSLIKWSMLLKKKSELVSSGVLSVVCRIKYPQSVEIESVGCKAGLTILLPVKKLLQDFKDLFLKKEDCDVILKVKGQEFPAHRTILAARSTVFAATYRYDTKEKTTGIIDIEDCEPSSFLDFLHFLYCGDISIISNENVFSLFTTGDKYNVQDLRAACVEFMKERLSMDTFCDTITVALQHSEKELITLATGFFTKHALDIAKTVKWQTFSANNPTQSNELFIKALAAKGSKE